MGGKHSTVESVEKTLLPFRLQKFDSRKSFSVEILEIKIAQNRI
jgi:hypothetical protein